MLELVSIAIKKGSVPLTLVALIAYLINTIIQPAFLEPFSAAEKLIALVGILMALFLTLVFVIYLQSSRTKPSTGNTIIRGNQVDGDFVMGDKITNNNTDSDK